MNALLKLAWVELKLFVREPTTMVFTLALPLLFLFVMGGVFGNVPDPNIYRGVGAMNYYAPAYIALAIGSIGVVGLPVHLTSYRERGVLRRLHASSISVWTVFGSQVLVSFVIAVLGGILITVVSVLTHDILLPKEPVLFLVAFALSVLGFAAVGILLGAVLPTARAAQGLGLMLFFVMLILGGAGPPREVLTSTMRWVGDVTPLKHTIVLVQDPWLGLGWNWFEFYIVGGMMLVATAISARVFRWE